ncbi:MULTISPECIES: hypothetical protein [unclassified Streptomyces]|uniref:hypothetical protein n=1 Tax=unclassified Streptomyces TaxID=2593676 RepID=UPI002E376126|nr:MULTISPECIES: hypothetical protein [unclassified Streptomyces]WUC68912.1 hypothetical protein OG861_31250 [Streptomyces sp. NBC_00539]
MQPVLEMNTPDGFALWPVAETERFGFLSLSGGLSPAEIGTALMRIAACNDVDPADDGDLPPRPAEPLSGFLHGLLNLDNLYAAGGLRITDISTSITFSPGCCDGLEDWRDWYQVLDGSGIIGYGHDPLPSLAERIGDTIRLTVDTARDDSPAIELSVTELRRLLAGAERDLTEFLAAATDWVTEHLPDHSVPLTAALARVLALPAPGIAPAPLGAERT